MVWSPHTKRNINNLEQVQRRATRFILGRDYSEHERLSKLNLLPLQYHREINDVVYFFKCFKNIYKLNIFDYVLFRSCIKPLRNVDNLTLDVPFSRTDVFKNSFFVRICRLWNELLLSIRELNTLSVVCENLMAFYHDKFNVDVFKFYTVLYQIFSPFIIILFISVHVACLS